MYSCSVLSGSQLKADTKLGNEQKQSGKTDCRLLLIPHPPPPATCVCIGLPKSSEQAYIEFESIEAIVKTASRTKFFIEFYSTCLEGELDIRRYPLRLTAQTGWMSWM